MDIRQLQPGYAVAPQIEPGDMAEIAAAGFGTVICNRPDGENPGHRASPEMRQAAEDAGLTFVFNPVTPGVLSDDNIRIQGAAISDAERPVLAYCASGNRSSIVWALSQAGVQPTETLVRAAADHGYNLEPYRTRIDELAR